MKNLSDFQNIDGFVYKKVDSLFIRHLFHVLVLRLGDHDKMADGTPGHGVGHDLDSVGMRKQQVDEHNVRLVK
ncbi:hypothetical protein SDC9_163902 [bioreactor metagenome]|uniref:Uncharacterized protein n=1 Tax=bioreactor metagenome TaxID=1076179 RepID=A0A645FQ53_9ZZZZ